MELIFSNLQWIVDKPQQDCLVYMWLNKKNKKKYVGQTNQGFTRIKNEIREQNNCKENESPLHIDIIQYGLVNFDIFILDYCDEIKLNIYEQYWIDKLDAINGGYNRTLGGSGFKNPCPYILRHEDNSYDIYSRFDEMLINRKMKDKLYCSLDFTDEKKVLCKYSREGFLLKIYEDTGIVADELSPLLGLSRYTIESSISSCQAKNWGVYNFIWKWSFLQDIKFNINIVSNKRRILQYDSNGVLIRLWNYINDIVKELGFSAKTIQNACQSLNHSACGFYWMYVTNVDIPQIIDPEFVFTKGFTKPVCQFTKQHELVAIYNSAAEASNKTGISASNINLVCQNKRKSAGNYIWEYYFEENGGEVLSRSL